MLTYRELLAKINELPDERLDDTVTIYHHGDCEFFPAIETRIVPPLDPEDEHEADGILDPGHMFIFMEG